MAESLIDELLEDARGRMVKSAEAAQHEFASVRTGRASPALLDRVVVDYYGAMTPLNQLATISAPEARLLTVQPYDKSSIKAIEKAINESDIGLNPSNDGNVVRLTVPELTEERRRELVKVVRNLAEEGRVAIRNVRRDTMHQLRELKSEGEASSDDEHRAEVELQKLNEGHSAGADTVKARLRDAAELGIEELTVYSFSTENWSRPAEEVQGLMEMFSKRIADETPELHREGVRMRFIGRREGVAEALRE